MSESLRAYIAARGRADWQAQDGHCRDASATRGAGGGGVSETPETGASDAYETMEALLCEMQGLRDEIVEVKRERDNLKQEVERLKTMSVCELGAHNNSVRDYMGHWEGRALTAERERDEAINILREINDWINVAVMRPPTPNEAAHAINTWGDKIRPILEATE